MARRRKIQHYGGSCVLGGNTPCASTASTTALNSPTAAITVEARIKPYASNVTDYAVIAAKIPDGTWADGGWAFYFTGRGELKFYVNHYVTGGVSSGTAKLLMNVWQHVTATYDGTWLRLYINGVQVGTPVAYSTPITQTAGYVGVGAIYGAQPHSSPCAIARIYARALTANEVADRYYEVRDDASMRTGLVGDWNFANIAGTSCPDDSGNGAAMTLYSASIASADSPCLARNAVRNHIAHSGSLSTTPWTNSRILPPSVYGGALPTGVSGMSVLTDDGSAGSHFAQQILTTSPRFGGKVVVSIYAKSLAGSGWIALGVGSGGPAAWFDLLNGVRGTSSGLDSSIELVDGLYRCAILVPDSWAERVILYLAPSNGALTFTAPPTQSMAVGGVQVEIARPGLATATPSPLVNTGAAPMAVVGRRPDRPVNAASSRGMARNLVLQSGHPDTAPWTSLAAAGATPSPYAGVLPEGVDAMVTLTDLGAGAHFANQAPSVPFYTDVIVSGYARKMAGVGWIAASLDGGASVAYFDINTGAVGTVSAGLSYAQIVETEVTGVYRWSFKQKTTNDVRLRAYIANGNAAASYAANGNAVAMGGFQIEVAAPGQLTPQLPISTLTATALGRRDTRQNLLPWSEDLTKWSNLVQGLNATLSGADPFGGTATLLDDVSRPAGLHAKWYPAPLYQTGTLALGPYYTATCVAKYVTGPGYLLVGASGIWATFDVKNGVVGNRDGTGNVSSSMRPLGGGWHELSMTYYIPTAGQYFRIGSAVDAGGVTNTTGDWSMLVGRVQIAQTNTMPDYVKTKGGIWCPNGAPRRLAI